MSYPNELEINTALLTLYLRGDYSGDSNYVKKAAINILDNEAAPEKLRNLALEVAEKFKQETHSDAFKIPKQNERRAHGYDTSGRRIF